MTNVSTIFIFFGCVALAYTSFPSNFKKCNRKDADFQQCCLNAANNGLSQLTKPFPELNLPNVDPLEIKVLNIEPGATGVVALTQKFHDCKMVGISKSILDKFEFNFAEKTLAAEGNIPDLKFQCQYEFDGKVMFLPIVGKGPSTIDLEKMKLSFNGNWEESKKQDKTFLKFTKIDLLLNPGLVEFNIENLFNGDKALGDNINKVLNENWSQVFKDVKSGYEQAFGLIIHEIFNDFFSKISMEDAFD